VNIHRGGKILALFLLGLLAVAAPAYSAGRHGASRGYQGRGGTPPAQHRDGSSHPGGHQYRHRNGASHPHQVIVRGAYVTPFFYADPFWSPWSYGFGFYGYGPYYPGPWPGDGIQAEPGEALVITDVSPGRAHVFVDGNDAGRASRFDHAYSPLWVLPGEHEVEIRARGYETIRLSMDLERGKYYKLQYDLVKGEGTDSRSTAPAEPPAPE